MKVNIFNKFSKILDLISLTVKHLELYNVNRYAHRRVETERCPEILQYVTTLRQTVDLKLLQSYSKNMLPANFEHDRESMFIFMSLFQ